VSSGKWTICFLFRGAKGVPGSDGPKEQIALIELRRGSGVGVGGNADNLVGPGPLAICNGMTQGSLGSEREQGGADFSHG